MQMKKWVLMVTATTAVIAWILVLPRVYAYAGEPVTVAQVHVGEYTAQVQCEGKVQAGSTQAVSYGFALRPSNIRVAVGDKIKAGQVLMDVDRDQTMAALALSTGGQSSGSSTVGSTDGLGASDSTDSQLQQALNDWMPQAASSLGGSAELDALLAQYAQYAGSDAAEQLKQQLISQAAQTSQTSASSGKTDSADTSVISTLAQQVPSQVVAPVSGVVTEMNVMDGSFTSPAQDLFVISDTDDLFLTAQVDESQIARVKEGQTVEITSRGESKRAYKGTVTKISPQAHEVTSAGATRSLVDVTVRILNPDADLLPNLSVDAAIDVRVNPRTLSVPYEAVQEDQAGQEYVMAVQDGRIRRCNIQTGEEFTDTVEVVSGLSGNEQVVLSPSTALKNGSPVVVKEVRHV